MHEYVLIDPVERQVEVFTRADAGGWLLTDRTGTETLVLGSIDLALPMAQVFRGVERREA